MIKKIVKSLIIFFVLAFIYAPILILAVYSFTNATQIGAIRSFSLHNYVTLFTTEDLIHMILGTIILAFGSRSNTRLRESLEGSGVVYYAIGDSLKDGDAKKAIFEATRLALDL